MTSHVREYIAICKALMCSFLLLNSWTSAVISATIFHTFFTTDWPFSKDEVPIFPLHRCSHYGYCFSHRHSRKRTTLETNCRRCIKCNGDAKKPCKVKNLTVSMGCSNWLKKEQTMPRHVRLDTGFYQRWTNSRSIRASSSNRKHSWLHPGNWSPFPAIRNRACLDLSALTIYTINTQCN